MIQFVYPPTGLTATAKPAPFRVPLATAYIIAYLRQKGLRAGQFMPTEPVGAVQCVRQILAQKPRVVGFTVYLANYNLCRLIARGLKEADPGIIIVFGGPTATSLHREIMAHQVTHEGVHEVDICVRNHGEDTCLELLTLLERFNFDLNRARPHFSTLRGITYRDGDRIDDRIIVNPDREFPPGPQKTSFPLDRFPSPYLSGVLDSAAPGLITARGCNRPCTYCDCAVLSGRKIHLHSTDRVIAELEYISGTLMKNPGPMDTLDILDDTFNLVPHRALEICNKLIENNIRLPLLCALRCDRVSEELLERMKEAGFKAVTFSLESAVPRVLRRIGKVNPPDTPSDPHFEKEKAFLKAFRQSAAQARKIGFETIYTSVMIGLPGETPEEARQTVDFIESMGKNLDFYAHNIFKIYPGTPISRNHRAHGLDWQPLGNGIHHRTIAPFDTAQIPPAANANLVRTANARRKELAKILALRPSTTVRPHGCFNTVILHNPVIHGETVRWLQDVLALNGRLIQVYPDPDQARENHEKNSRALLKHLSPTTNHTAYYTTYYTTRHRTTSGALIPRLVPVEDNGTPPQPLQVTDLPGTEQATTPNNNINPLHSVCIERRQNDATALYELLKTLGKDTQNPADMFEQPLYPYFSSICRWCGQKSGTANCRSLETAIVTPEKTVLCCWSGNKIGQVGDHFENIKKNLETLFKQTEKDRECTRCKENDNCSRCAFPNPLSRTDFCRLKQTTDTTTTADQLLSLDWFKQL